jgi:hypothetical protein
MFPRDKAPKEGKRGIPQRREYLVQWKGDQSKGSWTWKRVEDLNDGGRVLGPWLDYEAAIMRHDPAKASQLAKDTIPQHIGGADRGQDIRPDDRTRAAETRFAAKTKSSSTEVLQQTELARDALKQRPPAPLGNTCARHKQDPARKCPAVVQAKMCTTSQGHCWIVTLLGPSILVWSLVAQLSEIL